MTPKRVPLLVATSFLVIMAKILAVSAVCSPSDQIIYTDSGEDYSTSTVDGVDTPFINCNITDASDPPRWPVGEHYVFCTDESDNTTCTLTVTVRDNEPPTFTSCPQSDQTYHTTNGMDTLVLLLSVVQPLDNVEVTSSECSPMRGTAFNLGRTEVVCNATDAAGNSAMCNFSVIIRDGNPPVFESCPDSIHKTIDAAEMSWTIPTLSVKVTWDKPSASDNDLNPMLESSHDSGDEFPVGTTEVTYNATDKDGNKNVGGCSFSIDVTFQPQPEVSATYNEHGSTRWFNIKWTRSQNRTVREYDISVWRANQDESKAQHEFVPRMDGTYLTFDFTKKFSPGELYMIKVEALVGESRHLIGMTQQWTEPNEPEEVGEVPGTKSSSSVEVSWPRVSLQNVEQYWIDAEHLSGYVTKTTDKILLDNVFNNVLVKVRAVVGSGDMRLMSSHAQHPVSFQGNLEDSKLLALSTESTLRVFWKATPSSSSSKEPYMLYIEPEDAEENYLAVFDAMEAEFTGLKPNTEYQIRLVHNLGLSLSTSVKTKPGPPSNIRAIVVLKNSITLEWEPPTEGDVDSYEVYISPGDSTEPVEVSGTSHTFSSLTDKTEYFLKVVSVFEGVKSLPKTLMVTAGVTTPSPSSPVNILAIALGVVLGVVALLLIIGIVVTCRKIRKLKASMNTRAGYETAIKTVDPPVKTIAPTSSDQNNRPYQNSAIVDQMADRAVAGKKNNFQKFHDPVKQRTNDAEVYTYAAPQ